jgi:prepilin-type N-terminal cleavage/methylation domain-containing protein
VNPRLAARRRRQAGFTLIELIIATAIGLMIMGALTSVVLTTAQAANTATARLEASSQIRDLQLSANDDFVLSRAPTPSGCGTANNPCHTQPLALQGSRMANAVAGAPAAFTVTYVWDSSPSGLDVTRRTASGSRVLARNVTAFAWYVDSTGAHPTVVVSLTVAVNFYNAAYSQSQTLRFYPRVTSP